MNPKDHLPSPGSVADRCRDGVDALRDRRRRSRQRLEELFDRKTFSSVAVAGSLGKVIEKVIVPAIDPTSGIPWGRGFAWLVMLVVATAATLHWERLSRVAQAASETASEAADRASDAASEAADSVSDGE